MRYLLPLLILATACSPLGLARRDYLNALVGQPESEAIRQMGVPARVYEADGHKYLAFVDARQSYIGGGPFFIGGGGFYGGGIGYAATFPAAIVSRVCETTLDLASGRVVTWSLRGDGCGG